MCGIFACFNYTGDPKTFRRRLIGLTRKLSHRGPDWTGIEIVGNNFFGHERLSIVDVNTGDQPLKSKCSDCSTIVVANGEIYNHRTLREKTLSKHHVYGSESDCEIILHLYEEFGDDAPKYMDGDFAFVVFDGENFLIARDPIGVVPLYQGWSADGQTIWVASEMKSLVDVCTKILSFPPGHFYTSRGHTFKRWYAPKWFDERKILREPLNYKILRRSLEESVSKRLMCDVPYGVLLSGGLDSSLVASITSRKLKEMAAEVNGTRPKTANDGAMLYDWWKPALHSFSIGLVGSPDLQAAKEVAHFLGTSHHEFHFNVQEGIDCLPEVIYHLEAYDVSCVRAGAPMYLLARKIKSLGFKMVLSGEGSDEIFGGYLYFHRAPDAIEFHRESLAKLKAIHATDCLRANKSTAAWGVELRVPFLDCDFLNVAMSIDPTEKMHKKGERMEKYALRKAFEDPEEPYLPPHILWRQKDQFDDGVGYSWAESLKAHGESQVSDEEMDGAKETYPEDTPFSKEAYYYRKCFSQLFPNPVCRSTVQQWIFRADWGCGTDPSGRAEKAHMATF